MAGFSRLAVMKLNSMQITTSVRQLEPLRGLNLSGQAIKGARGMSWCQEAMKGVEVCEKPGGIDKRVLIPGFPN